MVIDKDLQIKEGCACPVEGCKGVMKKNWANGRWLICHEYHCSKCEFEYEVVTDTEYSS